MSTEETEQITKIPDNLDNKPQDEKTKDPKNVAAGKALAKKNKEARLALENQNQNQNQKQE